MVTEVKITDRNNHIAVQLSDNYNIRLTIDFFNKAFQVYAIPLEVAIELADALQSVIKSVPPLDNSPVSDL
jgi:hypothetical protein